MKNLYKISEISKLYKTTNRQLRFYEEKKILKPAFVDKNNKYRYYSEENCKELEKILSLKEIGFSLVDIAKYFNGSAETKKSLLLRYNNIHQQESEILNHIINNNDYNLSFINHINYTGNAIKNKDTSKLIGVWTLRGIYSNIKDAKQNSNIIEKFSPYQFLAFDESGNSPWFYSANNKKIIFNTFFTPCAENYQIINNELYIKITNYKEHIFGNIKNPIVTSHILVYKKNSDEYKDYIKFIHEDKQFSNFVLDNKIVGTWKSKNDRFLIIENSGKAYLCSNKGIESLIWTKNNFYDNELKVVLKYKLKGDILSLEKKTRIYKFCGINNGYEEFIKI